MHNVILLVLSCCGASIEIRTNNFSLKPVYHVMWLLFNGIMSCKCIIKIYDYHNDPKFLDRYAWANSADPDQTAPRGAV